MNWIDTLTASPRRTALLLVLPTALAAAAAAELVSLLRDPGPPDEAIALAARARPAPNAPAAPPKAAPALRGTGLDAAAEDAAEQAAPVASPVPTF